MNQRNEDGESHGEAREAGERPEDHAANPTGEFPWGAGRSGSQMYSRPQDSSYPPPQYGVGQPVTGWVTLGTGQQVELASPGARLGAKLIDWALFWLVTLAVILPIGLAGGSSGLGLVVLLFLMFGLMHLLYDPIMIAVSGQTVGKMATRIKVTRADNGDLPGWGKSIGRWVIPGVLYFIPVLGYILAILCYTSLTWDTSRQGWHDKAAGTVVIKV